MAKKAAKTKTKSTAKKTTRVVEAVKPIKRSFTTNEMISAIANQIKRVDEDKLDNDRLNKKIAKAIMESLGRLVKGSVAPGGVGKIKLFGLLNVKTKKVKARKIPAIKKGTMVANPFNGGKLEPHKGRPASVKPAHVKVKIVAMKGLKEAANK